MTKQEAIERLHNLQSINEDDLSAYIGVWYKGIKDDYAEALNMAIEALSAMSSNEYDLIYRNDAKTLLRNRAEELKGVYGDIGGSCSGAAKLIDNLPTAQAERKGEWVKDAYGTVVCSECKGIRRDNRISHMNWCNSCGCRMIGEKV